MSNLRAKNVLNMDNFVAQNGNAKSHITETINQLVRNVNKHKLEYDQLRFILKRVREKCQIEHPKRARKLPQTPSRKEVDQIL